MRNNLSLSKLLLFCSVVFFTSVTQAQCPACQRSVDLIVNGDFENGNTGFTSSMDYVTWFPFVCVLCPENSYAIGANATLFHNGFTGNDHTNPPNGDFFIANAAGQSNALTWCQTITVLPNVDYTFSFWARDITNNNNPHPLSWLQASFNGVLMPDTLIAEGGWQQYITTWNSGNATSLDLCIVNQQWQTGGNDFGLDDISLTACHPYFLSQPAFAGNDAEICGGEILQLGQTTIPGYTYSWNNGTGLSSTIISNPNLQIDNSGPDDILQEYVVTRDSANVGCIESDTVVITVHPLPPFSLGEDLIVCPGENTTVDAGDTWDSVTWSDNQTTPQITVGAGDWSATVTYGDCSATDAITVSEEFLPELDLGPDQDLCSDTSLVLDAGYLVTWNNGSISDTLLVEVGGMYTATYNFGACSISDSVQVTLFDLPVIVLPEEITICEGSSATLDAGTPVLWSTGEIASSITVTEEGYYDMVAENGPCHASYGTTVQVNPLPRVNLGDDLYICEDRPVELIAFDEINEDYRWSTGDTTSTLSVTGPGDFSVIVTNSCGSDSSDIHIDVYPCAWDIYVPSCFTPNDDQINDYWAVQGYNVTNVKIFVYNRFGDLIFYAKELGAPWYPSTGVYDDVYNYRIEAITFEGENLVQHGHIYLIR